LPERGISKGRNGQTFDAYYLYKWGNPGKGGHLIEVTVKNLNTNAMQTYKKTFDQN